MKKVDQWLALCGVAVGEKRGKIALKLAHPRGSHQPSELPATKNPANMQGFVVTGAPERIRTSDLCLRRAALYPAELRVLERPQ